jgi:hypothetical protein
VKDEVKEIKMKCFHAPEKYLWTASTKKMKEVRDIFYHLKSLNYDDKPDYEYIRSKLRDINNHFTINNF